MAKTVEEQRSIIEKKLKVFAKYIDMGIPENWGFGLMIYEFGGKGQNMQWISNGERAGMIKSMRELADRLEFGFAGEKGVDDSNSRLEVGDD